MIPPCPTPTRDDPDPCTIICTILAGVGLLLSLEQKIASRRGGEGLSQDLRAVRRTRLAIEDLSDSVRTLRRFWSTWKSLGEERLLTDPFPSPSNDDSMGMEFGRYGRFFSEEEYSDFADAYDEALSAIGKMNRALARIRFSDMQLDPVDSGNLFSQVQKLRQMCNDLISRGPVGRVEELLQAADSLVRRLRAVCSHDDACGDHSPQDHLSM